MFPIGECNQALENDIRHCMNSISVTFMINIIKKLQTEKNRCYFFNLVTYISEKMSLKINYFKY